MSTAAIDTHRIGFDSATFEAFLAARSEPSWITDARRAAFEIYQNLLQEDLDPEEFKRVDLRVFNAGKFRPTAETADSTSISTLLSDKTEFGGSIAHVNGQSTYSQVSDEIKGQGVLFGELQTLLYQPSRTARTVFYEAGRASGCGPIFGMACCVLDRRDTPVCSTQRRQLLCRCTV